MSKRAKKVEEVHAESAPSGKQAVVQPGIDDLRFYDLCYTEYRQEMQQVDVLYQRFGILVTALPIIAAVAYKLGRPELVPKWFTRVDVFLYCTLAACAYIAISVSLVFLMGALIPGRYRALECMKKWQDWRNEYRRYLAGGQQDATGETESAVSRHTLNQLLPLLADAQSKSSEANEKRRKRFRWAVIMACISVGIIGGQAFLHMLLFLQGV